MPDDKAKWLAGLEVGDLVTVKYSCSTAGYPGTITQLGASLIVVNNGSCFKRNGRQGHHGLWLEKPKAGKAKR